MKKKYERIVSFVNEKRIVTLESFVNNNPDISSDTYHQTMSKLRKHGLVAAKMLDKRKLLYNKTDQFTAAKALETLRVGETEHKYLESMTLERRIQEAVENVVDPASGLTFREMKIEINIRESPDAMFVEFVPSFCPLATELTSYVEKAIREIPYPIKAQILCRGYSPKKGLGLSKSDEV
jgi:hypothetical protein